MFADSDSIAEAIASGRTSAYLTYSGQDPDWAEGLSRTLEARPALRDWCAAVLVELSEMLVAEPTLLPEMATAGIEPTDWLEDFEERWTKGQRSNGSLCLMGSALAHFAATLALVDEVGDLITPASGVAGHSAGLLSAWVVARYGTEIPSRAAAEAMAAMGLVGAEAQKHPESVPVRSLEAVFAGENVPTPMLSVSGLTEPRLVEELELCHTDTVRVTLQNSFDRFVLSGRPEELKTLAEDLADVDGVRCEFLPSTVGYHHEWLKPIAIDMAATLERAGIAFSGDLTTTLIDPRDCTHHVGGDLTVRITESMSCNAVRWADFVNATVGAGDVLIDVGPSGVVGILSRRALRGSGATVVLAGTPEGLESLRRNDRVAEPLLNYRDFLPTVDKTSPRRISTKHSRLTGRSAFVLAGMTPSTSDAEIVAAAANAGNVAELAGGGQVSSDIFSERFAELSERLTGGHEVVFNALYLDPYLWGLQLGKDRLVQRARAAGAPINGVTISAGVPETDEALELLDDLNDLGIWLNAFKPGTRAQVKSVLDIASRTDHDIWVHLEGGRAGGHHSWVDLEELLFSSYNDFRSHDNVILCVGGGIGSADRAGEFLGGEWALKHGAHPMPVDAILVGTAAMATAESTASDSVKQLLAQAPGTDVVVASGEIRGGVTSGRSGLNADIHYLDNTASRVATLLGDLAGDADAIDERHDEIAEALNKTAKPWFGPLSEMTYLDVAERFVELTALGRNGRYEDGLWLDVTHRNRFFDLLQRFEARCVPQDEGTVVSVFQDPASLDDPAKAAAILAERFPVAASAELLAEDVAYFIDTCDRPGKPVPFVAVIDAEVRRRYLADSLWQSHSDHWDADEVLIIPGPAAVAGIEFPDEPVADLLDRFESGAAESLADSGAVHAGGDAQAASAAEHLIGLPSMRWGGSMLPSPVLAATAGGEWEVDADGSEVVATLSAGSESAVLRGPKAPLGRVDVEFRWPSAKNAAGDGEFRFAVDVSEDSGVVFAEMNGDSIAAAQEGILGMLTSGAESVAADAERTSLGGESPSMAALWPSVFAALADAGVSDGLLRLVHLRNVMTLHSRDSADVGCEISRDVNGPAGRLIRTSAWAPGVTSEDTFLIRSAAPTGAPIEPAAAVPEGWKETPRHHLGTAIRYAPRHPEVFAELSGDFNPIHRSDLVARMAGLPGRIAHGMWTSHAAQKFLVAELGGDESLLKSWEIDFLGIVEPAAKLNLVAERVAIRDGERRVEVRVEVEGVPVAVAHATVAAPRTAYVFPGQGIQAQGMGLDGMERCPAAKAVWGQADDYCRSEIGFSVIEVVRDNPKLLEVGGETFRHPGGVLNLTQFTQVAMATLAAAQTAELQEAGALVEGAFLAGHSVGEYNALAASAGVLPLEAVLGIVWARGTAMHNLVERDATGASTYRLGVVRPHLAGIDAEGVEALVERVAQDSGELCEIVNHNLRGRQYAVAGTVTSLEELSDALGEGTQPGRDPFLLVPGIDVPFHSRALEPGVPEFKRHLDDALPPEVDPESLVGRYVPNLHPEPFSLDRSYVEAVSALCGEGSLAGVLEDWDAAVANPRRLARELLVEILAWQFASPVRWIESTEVLLTPRERGGLGVERVVEIGLGSAPTLTGLTKAAVAAEHFGPVEVLNLEIDADVVFCQTSEAPPAEVPAVTQDEPDDDPAQEDWDGDAPPPATKVAAAAIAAPSTDSAPDVADVAVEMPEAVEALLAHITGMRVDQLADDSIDDLVDGASSRRNQVLMDLGREFGLGSVDGAHEVSRSELSTKLGELARSYSFPGPVLASAVSSGVTSVLGPVGGGDGSVAEHLSAAWGLGPGWVNRVRIELALAGRGDASRRGGALRTLSSSGSAPDLIDEALAAVAERAGVSLAKPAEAAGGTVDSAELTELAARVDAAFSSAAGAASAALHDAETPQASHSDDPDASSAVERLALLDSEHGAGRADAVAPVFDVDQIRLFDSGTAWARADLDHLYSGLISRTIDPAERLELVDRLRQFAGADERVDAGIAWYLTKAANKNSEVVDVFTEIAAGADQDQIAWADKLAGRTVLLSGASPGSIAEAAACRLLASGATVVLVTSSLSSRRRRHVRDLERRFAAPGAKVFLVGANLASFTDIDRLVEWLNTPAEADAQPSPGLPDVVLPFAAPPVLGDAADSGPTAEIELRVLLLGVERLVGKLAEAAGTRRDGSTVTAVLPMSPNHGTFGGDGAYGTAKAGLEVLDARSRSEHKRWGQYCRIIGAEIGWVRGTGLMEANDDFAPIVEQRLGVRTFSAAEMGDEIAALCVDGDRSGRVDLTGGMSDLDDPGALSKLLRSAVVGNGVASEEVAAPEGPEQVTLNALVSPVNRPVADLAEEWPDRIELAADDMIVICGTSEIGPWGTSSTRAAVERSGRLDAASVVELAIGCGLVEWKSSGSSGEYVDSSTGDVVASEDLVERYRADVEQRCGIRLSTEGTYPLDTEIFSGVAITLDLPDEDQARGVLAAVPGATLDSSDGKWSVTLPKGSPIRVPQIQDLPRGVTAAIPEGMIPEALGLPVEIASSVDPLAAWTMLITAEAFRDAGTDPEELLGEVHPSRMGSTQGTGMGGMQSLRAMYMDPLRGVPHANDMLQEALGNVPAAHAMQSYVGGYGPMVHPVAACATAAVSLEAAVDLISVGKADVIIGGGIDDLGPEGIIGFADMAATASSEKMLAAGFDPSELSRPGDRSRAGFVESQGGGAMVICRGSIARKLGLPVKAVVGLARSYSDGVQTSIPAPGLGLLCVGMGAGESPLAKALADHGLGADDIAAVSKHDTSTRANDPNEAEIHETLQRLIGRTPGNPLRVISQKHLTGHPKGGAAAWQIAGLCDLFSTGVVPGNANLDCVDPDMERDWLTVDDRPLQLAETPKAALLTSLGFGHVSAAVLLIHPAAFSAALEPPERDRYLAEVARRTEVSDHQRRWDAFGGGPAYQRLKARRLEGEGHAEQRGSEVEILTGPTSRLVDGVYALSSAAKGSA